MAFKHVHPLDPAQWVTPRANETKVGQAVSVLTEADLASPQSYQEALATHHGNGARVAIVGVPESIGPRANLGRAGAEDGWPAFLKSFLNLQANGFTPSTDVLLIGAVNCDELQQRSLQLDPMQTHELAQLRDLCQRLDALVLQVITPLFVAGYEVVLIGGGHNNAYPLLRALAEQQTDEQGVSAVNFDPHADFRAREGRHSGNGFSFAFVEGYLQNYHVFGLHEGKNNASSLQQLHDAGFRYQSIHHIQSLSFRDALADCVSRVASWQRPLGVELDVDGITGMPASALNYAGTSVAEACQFAEHLAKLNETRYLHLAEAAPCQHPAGADEGWRHCGQVLSELVLAYLRGSRQRTKP